MPGKETLERAREDRKEGKSLSTQAREFEREEIEHVREGKQVALSSQARRSGRQRGSSAQKNSARRAVRTQGRQGLRKAARKTAQTLQSHAVRR